MIVVLMATLSLMGVSGEVLAPLNEMTIKFLGAILVIFLAMGLYAMGIANDIIELAFGSSLGAIAVAFALVFGLGGREAAGQEVKDFFRKMKKDNDQDQITP